MARFLKQGLASTCPKGTTIVNCSNAIIEMHPRVVLRRENVPRGPEVVNRSLIADCTDFTMPSAGADNRARSCLQTMFTHAQKQRYLLQSLSMSFTLVGL